MEAPASQRCQPVTVVASPVLVITFEPFDSLYFSPSSEVFVFKITIGLFLLPAILSAGNISTNWFGGADNNYANVGNWDNGVPNNAGATTYSANIFVNQNNPVLLGTDATIDMLSMGLGNSLTVSSSNNFTVNTQALLNTGANLLLNSGTQTSLGNLVNLGTITSLGTLALPSNPSNGGTIQLQGGAQMTLSALTNFLNSTPGQLVVDGSTLTFNNGVLNGGITTGQNGAVMNFNNNIATGTVNVNTASLLNLNGATVADLNTGTTGTVNVAATTSSTISGSLSNGGQVTLSNSILDLHGGGTHTNDGTISVSNNGLLAFGNAGASTVNGTGTIDLQNGAIAVAGNLTLGPGQTVKGQGTIQGNSVANQGTIRDSGAINITSNSFTNTGNIVADNLVAISPTDFTNYANNTLTGGSYDVTGILAIKGADIQTNQASITLHDSGQIAGNGSSALTHFTLNDTGASFTITGTAVFAAPVGGFTNDGAVVIGAGTLFLMNNGDTYTQNSGSTEVDGDLLQAGNVVLNGGTLSGVGNVHGNLQSNGATVAPGDAPGPLTVFGTYLQSANSQVDIEFATLTEYSQLNILTAGLSTLQGGTLHFIADAGFNAPLGQVFLILNAPGGLSGSFDSFTTNYFAGSKMFQEIVLGNAIGALVVPAPEPATFLLVGIALAIAYSKWSIRRSTT